VNSLRVSAVKPYEDQQTLFGDRHVIDSPAAVRTLVGGFFEEATRRLFQAHRHQIDGTADVCPDFSVDGRTDAAGAPLAFLEVKSIGQGRQALVYEKRLRNDRRLVRSGRSLTYVFWIHDVRATEYTSRESLYEALGRGVSCVLVVPFRRISAACRKLTPRVMNYRTPSAGHPNAEPMPGYRLSWSLLCRLAAGKAQVERTVGRVYGVDVGTVTIHGSVAESFAPIAPPVREMAGELLTELSHARLEVLLADAPRPAYPGHKVRKVVNRNPSWYRRLCESHPNARRHPRQRRAFDTGIKRHQVERALERLAAGRCVHPYDWLLLPIVQRFAAAARAA
jgi:hypothetical protein